MAVHDSLKSLVRQYIKTNGQNEITGQILQNVLIAMIDELGITIDPTPTKNSSDAVSSGGTFGALQQLNEINATLSGDGKIYNNYQAGDIYYTEQNSVRVYWVALADGEASEENPVTISDLNFYHAENATDAVRMSLSTKTFNIDAYTKQESDAKYQPKGNYQPAGDYATEQQLAGKANASDVYTKQESDAKYQPKGNYQPAGDYATEQQLAGKANASDVYTKSETYSKAELDNLITTPNQQYVSVTATAQTTAITDLLPATGAADTIYRVGNWDGTQYDPTMYALFAWNGTTYVCLAVRSFVGEVYDVSVNHPDGQGNPTPYADLTTALGTSGANIPADIRRGGMSIKFIQGNVQSSDNKYVQYFLTKNEWSIDTNDWEKINLEEEVSQLSQNQALLEYEDLSSYMTDEGHYARMGYSTKQSDAGQIMTTPIPVTKGDILFAHVVPGGNIVAVFAKCDANGENITGLVAGSSTKDYEFAVDWDGYLLVSCNKSWWNTTGVLKRGRNLIAKMAGLAPENKSNIDEILNNGGLVSYEDKTALVSNNGYYVNVNTKAITQMNGYSVSSPISVKCGDVIQVRTNTDSNIISVISRCDVSQGNITPLVVSENDGVLRNYNYTCDFNGYVIVCCRNSGKHLYIGRSALSSAIPTSIKTETFSYSKPQGGELNLSQFNEIGLRVKITMSEDSGYSQVYFIYPGGAFVYVTAMNSGSEFTYDIKEKGYLRILSSNGIPYSCVVESIGLLERVTTIETTEPLVLPLSSKIFMRVGCIGDSYTSGHIQLSGEEPAPSNPNYSWPHYMEDLTNNIWTNFGKSGSSAKTWMNGQANLSQVQAQGNKCQAYIIGLMINDKQGGTGVGVPVGTSADIGTNADTYYAWYYKLIQAVILVNDKAKIFCNTCPNFANDDAYNIAVRDIVDYCFNNGQEVYLCDLASSTYNNKRYYQNPIFRRDYLSSHFTAIGYEFMAECFLRILSDVINEKVNRFQNVFEIPYDGLSD